MGLKKLLKKAKKKVKKAINLNPLVPGSKAQKKLSGAAKKALPVAAALGGTGAVSAAQNAAQNILPGSNLTQPGGFFDSLGDLFEKAKRIGGILEGTAPGDAPVQPVQPRPQGMNPTILIGAAAVVVVVLIARKGT